MRRFLKIFFGIILTLYAILLAGYAFLFLGAGKPAEEVTWGVTFGHSQAIDLGLDPKETYTALLDDLGVRNFRLPVYWDELEAEHDIYDFSAWDWQLSELEKRGGKAIVVVGFKLPRWPECRFPEWHRTLSIDQQKRELFQILQDVVLRYKDHSAVWAWQVENEPLLVFGECPPANKKLLDEEIDVVRKIDPSRPVIVTDTGEWSIWYEAGKRADIVGSTLYRVIHDPKLGFVEYTFVEPEFYARKARFLRAWSGKKVIVTELQAEPWVEDVPISSWPIDYQFNTMSPAHFRSNIDFARRTGFETFYLWGSEWWYWIKNQGHPEIWEEARKLFEAPK